MLQEDSSTSETASPLSKMTEEEQLEICQRLAIIGQMSSTIVREEDKRKEEKEIKSDTGTMIDSKHCHQQAWKLIMIVIVIL